jgi:hypothetical protein
LIELTKRSARASDTEIDDSTTTDGDQTIVDQSTDTSTGSDGDTGDDDTGNSKGIRG